MDFFSTLPAPLPLMIIEAIEDLPSLHRLIQASSSAATVFKRNPRNILETILSYYPPELQRLLYLILNFRSGGSTTTRDQSQRARSVDTFLDGTFVSELQPSSADTNLPSTASFSILATMSLVKDADHIQQLAHSFLGIHLARSARIEPSYQLDPFYHYRASYPKQPPVCRRYKPMNCGPPSWVEEQRVLRALWRLQLYFDLLTLGISSQPDDVTEFLSILRQEGPHKLWERLAHWELRELDCVYEYLLEISNESMTTSHLFRFPDDDYNSVAIPAPRPRETKAIRSFGQAEMHLNQLSPGANFMGPLRSRPDSPVHGCDLKQFWDFGLGLWDKKRMVFLGLLAFPTATLDDNEVSLDRAGLRNVMNHQFLSIDDMFTRWSSIVINVTDGARQKKPTDHDRV